MLYTHILYTYIIHGISISIYLSLSLSIYIYIHTHTYWPDVSRPVSARSPKAGGAAAGKAAQTQRTR